MSTDKHIAAMVAALPCDESWRNTRLSPLVAALGEQWWQPSSEQPAINPITPPIEPLYNAIRLDANSNLPTTITQQQQCLIPPHDAFTAQLNAAFTPYSTATKIADHSTLSQPLLLVHQASSGAHYQHHTLDIGNHSEATLIEIFNGEPTNAGLCSNGCHITLQPNAQLTHYRIQHDANIHYYLAFLQVNQQRDAQYRLHAIELGGHLSRLDVIINLQQAGAACDLHGLFVLDGNQHVDHHITMNHAAPHCRSRADYRTVLNGRSHAVFNGKVTVQRGAIKTDSCQNSANLLLSKRAQIDTKPELEIYNDDVQCAHGATVGQLDEEQLFYLLSRGIAEDEARNLLITAFAERVLMSINNNTLRKHIAHTVLGKLQTP